MSNVRYALALLVLAGCGSDRSSSAAPPPQMAQQTAFATPQGLGFMWSGPTADYPSPADASQAIQTLYAEWVTEGTQRAEPMMVHYADVQLVLGAQIWLYPTQWVGSGTYEISPGVIKVAMDGIWTDPNSGIVYEDLRVLKYCWDKLCGFVP
jgi:hypothetical protein